jgi:hypothetical protein
MKTLSIKDLLVRLMVAKKGGSTPFSIELGKNTGFKRPVAV